MWHGLPAREITAKMAVPPIKQLRLNTYKAGATCVRLPKRTYCLRLGTHKIVLLAVSWARFPFILPTSSPALSYFRRNPYGGVYIAA